MTDSKRRILVVEDQRLIAADLQMTLRKLGYEPVGIAATGEDAVQQALHLTPELILMDIRLRGDMDGIEAAQRIHEHLDVPVVYLTAYADQETIVRAKVTTPFGYVLKPFNERELQAAIEIALYKSESEHALLEERARRVAAEEFKALIDEVRDYAIYRLDTHGRVASWNSGAERIKGYRAEEVLGRHYSLFFPPEAVEQGLPEALLQTAAAQGRAEHEGVRRRKDDSEYWGAVTVTALHQGAPQLRGYGVIVRDLSERKAYEKSLEDSEQRFRTAVLRAPVPMMLHADNGEILAVSDAVVQSTGYSRDALGTWDEWCSLAYSGCEAEARAIITNAFLGERPPPTELAVRTASGECKRWLFSISKPLLLGQGRVGVVVVAVDVTALRQAEEQLQEAHRQKDKFIAMLGHELRNPLAAVRSASELLNLLSYDDAKFQRAQKVLERQTTHMAALINDLLDVSRLVQGPSTLNMQPAHLVTLLEETLEDRVQSFREKDLELHIDFGVGNYWVDSDWDRLKQVFDNLLSNAIKFTPEGGHVYLSARREGDSVTISLRDTGAGIDSALLPYVFEPFRQAEQSLHREAGGLGLGLAIVKGIVELHGGSVEVECPPKGGTTFAVRLPISQARGDRDVHQNSKVHGTRVLIVEDNEDTADTLRTVLETLGSKVAVTYDGDAAIEQVHAFHPEVVLCDLGLPGSKDGYEVARTLRAEGEKALLVAVSGYGRSSDIEKAYDAGFDAHLTKPIGVEHLKNLLAQSNGSVHSTQPPRSSP